jgi:hypothetical protein
VKINKGENKTVQLIQGNIFHIEAVKDFLKKTTETKHDKVNKT